MTKLSSNKYLSKLRNLARLANTQLSDFSVLGPKSININLTNVCNTDCIFCPLFSKASEWELPDTSLARIPRGAPPGRRTKDRTPYTDFTYLENLARELIEMQVEEVFLAGYGDPILHPRIEEICALFGKSHHTVLITNGISLDLKRREKMLMGNVCIRLSLHAATESTWKAIHPMNDQKQFHRITSVIKEIQRSYGDRVVIHNVICRQNFRESISMFELASELGVRQVGFLPVFSENLKEREKFDLGLEEKRALLKDLLAIVNRSKAMGVVTNAEDYAAVLNEELIAKPIGSISQGHDSSALYKKVDCNIGYVLAFVSAEKDVYPCCRSEAVNTFQNSSFKEVWNSESYRAFRRAGKQIRKIGNVPNSNCGSCQNFIPNIKIHNTLHPLDQLRLPEELLES